MAFTWSRVLSPGIIINKKDMDEIKNNINSLHVKLLKTNANFGTGIHGDNSIIEVNKELQNYRKVLDSIHSKNNCSHYSSHNATVTS